MTVKELIEELKKYPENTKIEVVAGWEGRFIVIEVVYSDPDRECNEPVVLVDCNYKH